MSDLHPLPADTSVLAHIVDAHCHPTDSALSPDVMSALPHRICAMATRGSDQQLVRALAEQYPDKVIPCFGYHPWFTHWISLAPSHSLPAKRDHYASLFLPHSPPPKPQNVEAFDRLLPFLPDPVSLEQVTTDLRAHLAAFPRAMVGEVGLDRACRVPYSHPASTPYADAHASCCEQHGEQREHADGEGSRPERLLSPFTIPLSHQVVILEAQLDVAVEIRRNASVHSVKAQQATVELLMRMKARHTQKWEDISVDMHSCGISAQGWLELEKAHHNLFLSLSTVINTRSSAHVALLQCAAPTRILVESDFDNVSMSAPYTWDMVCRIAAARGWHVEQTAEELEGNVMEASEKWGVVRQLEDNWRAFERGGHRAPPEKRRRDKKRLVLDESEEE